MSDLLAPLLVVMENEVDTFWCFAGLMEIVVGASKLSSKVLEYSSIFSSILL